jgi:hypothetical protein
LIVVSLNPIYRVTFTLGIKPFEESLDVHTDRADAKSGDA